MKKLLIIFCALMAFTACQESLEDRAARELSEFTKKNCPTPVQQDLRTDSASYDAQTRTLRYYFRLYGKTDNAQGISQNKKKIRQMLLDGLKSNTKLKAYKDNGFNFRYIYRSNSDPSKTLLDFTFTQKDYK